MAYDDIPDEIKQYDQWINWLYEPVYDKNGNQEIDEDGNPRVKKVPARTIDGKNASVNNPLDWTSFEQAKQCAVRLNIGLGFVFTKSDPFAGIDLDDPKEDKQISERQQEIFQSLNSYSERSPSGKGLHIITKAVLTELGRRRNKIECYDNLRFFTFTGDVYHNVPIMERQEETLAVYNSIGSAVKIVDNVGLGVEQYIDAEVIQHARNAVNGDKFIRLWEGDWQTDYGTKSQSEADFALIDIIAFYSRNLTQTIRVFRQSVLGKRQKANRNDYVMRMARRSFDRLPTQATMLGSETWFNASDIEPWKPKILPSQMGAFHIAGWTEPPKVSYTQFLPPKPNANDDPGRELEFSDPIPPMHIPGLVGRLVEQTWNSSIHQMAETAIASALSTMSLLCARSYRHGSLGLSLYIMLLAQTSTGKSFGYSANDRRFNAMIAKYKALPPPKSVQGKARAELLQKMVMGEVGSAPGLAQQFEDAPSTLAQLDEYVDTIRIMAQPNPPAHLAQIRSELLKLMEMSGPGRIYRGRRYSKRASGALQPVDVFSASLTILATGTPEQFYDELSPSLLTTGFLPRFTILEYEGGLTRKNSNPNYEIDYELLDNLCFLFDRAVNISGNLTGLDTEFVNVTADAQAHEYLNWFENVCYREIQNANLNRTNMAGIWSRAKEHVRQIASLIAIGCNPNVPIIAPDHVGIAIKIVQPTIDKIQLRVTRGEIGTGDDRREAEIKAFIVRMIENGWLKYRSLTGAKKELFESGYFQISVIRGYCTHLAAFKNHRMGASRAFEEAMGSLIKYGALKFTDCDGFKCVSINPIAF